MRAIAVEVREIEAERKSDRGEVRGDLGMGGAIAESVKALTGNGEGDR